MDKKLARKNTSVLQWDFAGKHPAVTFLIITFLWSWLVWLAAIPLQSRDDLRLMLVVFIGGYGPALGGIFSQALKQGVSKKN